MNNPKPFLVLLDRLGFFFFIIISLCVECDLGSWIVQVWMIRSVAVQAAASANKRMEK